MKSKKIFFIFLFSVGILADSFEDKIFQFFYEIQKEVYEFIPISDSEEVGYGKKLAKQMKREFREIQNSSSKTLQEMGKKNCKLSKKKKHSH